MKFWPEIYVLDIYQSIMLKNIILDIKQVCSTHNDGLVCRTTETVFFAISVHIAETIVKATFYLKSSDRFNV